jgi:D-3-phosphoglycerate dehydrogenase
VTADHLRAYSRDIRVFLTHSPEDLDAYYRKALPQLQSIAEVKHNSTDRDLTTPELIRAAADCQVIVAHRATPGDAILFDRSPELLAFLRCAVDISTVDVDAASRNGVLVGRAGPTYVPSTAELALGLMLDTARHISTSTINYQDREQPPQRLGRQLRGKTAGIIGYGSIGRYLADILLAIGLHVLVYDPYVDDLADGVVGVDLERLLSDSDVVFPLAPGESATENLIGAPELAAMKRGAALINVSRGELLDEDAVGEALDSGQLGALGMDVGRAPDQRPSPDLAGRPGVVATPHLGGLTPENAYAQALSSVEQVQAILNGSTPPRAVNESAATRLRSFWDR